MLASGEGGRALEVKVMRDGLKGDDRTLTVQGGHGSLFLDFPSFSLVGMSRRPGAKCVVSRMKRKC